jgi:hypothetical protein
VPVIWQVTGSKFNPAGSVPEQLVVGLPVLVGVIGVMRVLIPKVYGEAG